MKSGRKKRKLVEEEEEEEEEEETPRRVWGPGRRGGAIGLRRCGAGDVGQAPACEVDAPGFGWDGACVVGTPVWEGKGGRGGMMDCSGQCDLDI